MDNTKAFYTLSDKIVKLQDKLDEFGVAELREQAKLLPKKSQERKELNNKINEIIKSEEFKLIKKEMDTVQECLNIVFYR
ncbi:MAG: hypothetical protein ACRDDY_07940 [Clostridium sp.]|uniref:hypothetical protein n=1 Tax=Clostridium sp. TaxID=1506 RepID=UPI003EE7AF50